MPGRAPAPVANWRWPCWSGACKRLGLAALEHRAELIGVNAMHGAGLGADREPYEVRVRLAARTPTRALAEQVGQEVEALYLNGPAGGGGVTHVGARGDRGGLRADPA